VGRLIDNTVYHKVERKLLPMSLTLRIRDLTSFGGEDVHRGPLGCDVV
jgi:hypothetical protein